MRFISAPADTLRRVTVELFVAAGMAADIAETVATVQLEADLRGMHSHGLRAIPMYLRRVKDGTINGKPDIRVEGAVVHGDDGPGQAVAHRAMSVCIERAKANGVAFTVARRSNHLGAVGYYANMAAAEGLIGFSTTNGNLVLAPPEGGEPVVGNNPLAWAVPAGEEPPLCFDVATSVAAVGKVDLRNAEGDAVPSGWMIGGVAAALGAPDAPHKGFGLALALEALGGVLAGARFGRQHTLEVEGGPRPWDEGHFFMALDPALVMPRDEFARRMDEFVRDVRAAGGRVPGEAAHERKEEALRSGVPMPRSIYVALAEEARKAGTPTQLSP